MAFPALVMTINETEIDVLTIYKPEEEKTVSFKDVEPLEPFEVEKSSDMTEDPIEVVERLKSEARILFTKRDFQTAAKWYQRALLVLSNHFSWRDSKNSVRRVVVRAQGSVYAADVVAIRNEVKLENKSEKSERVLVSLIKEEECRVSSKCDDEDDDELTLVSGNNILASIVPNEHRQLQCSIYLNLTRCDLAVHSPQLALWHATIALRIASLPCTIALSANDIPWNVGVLCTGYFLRSKAHLVTNCLPKARRDAQRANLTRPHQREVVALCSEIEGLEEKRRKADRLLAREIGKWTESALKRHTEASASGDPRCDGVLVEADNPEVLEDEVHEAGPEVCDAEGFWEAQSGDS